MILFNTNPLLSACLAPRMTKGVCPKSCAKSNGILTRSSFNVAAPGNGSGNPAKLLRMSKSCAKKDQNRRDLQNN